MIDGAVLVIGLDPALCDDDLESLAIALQKIDGIELVYIDRDPGTDIARQVEEFRASLPEPAVSSEPPSSLPYWRRFERKRWPR